MTVMANVFVLFNWVGEIHRQLEACGSSLKCLTLNMCVRIIIQLTAKLSQNICMSKQSQKQQRLRV